MTHRPDVPTCDTAPRSGAREPGPHADRLEPGARVGSYVIDTHLSSGGFGAVYRAARAIDGQPAAIKVLHAEQLKSVDATVRCLREVQVLRNFEHPNGCRLLEVDALADGRPYFAMELLEGIDLHDRLEERGRLDLGEVLAILEPVCDAVTAAHELGIVHRDLKPSNVFLSESRGPVVLDFGISELLADGALDLASSRFGLGTPWCISPEQILGREVNGRADVYALGCTSFAMLSGQLPFASPNRSQLYCMHLFAERPRVPRRGLVGFAVDDVLARAMATDPTQRFETPREFHDALRAATQRRSKPAATNREQRCLAVHVEVRPARCGGVDDVAVDDIEAALTRADSFMRGRGFELLEAASTSAAYLFPIVALAGNDAAERSVAVAAAVELYRQLWAARLDVSVCMDIGSSGSVDDPGAWLPDQPISGVLGVLGVFDGLELRVESIDDKWSRAMVTERFLTTASSGTTSSSEHESMMQYIGRNLAGLAHDLRTPLAAIAGNVGFALDVAERGGTITEELIECMRDAAEAVDQLTALVDSVRAVTAVRGFDTESRAVVSTAEIVATAVNLTTAQVRDRAEIAVVHEDDTRIRASRARLVTAIVNLIVNAAQAMAGRGGSIEIRTRADGQWVELAVRDDGVGMPREVVERVFEPFFSTKPAETGSGMGLAQVRQIVDQHGGSVAVESTPGVGSTFTLRLPAA